MFEADHLPSAASTWQQIQWQVASQVELSDRAVPFCVIQPGGKNGMLSLDGVVHLSASDLVGHLNCRYLTDLDLAVAKGELDKPSIWDPVLEVLAERGALHEQSYLAHLEANGFPVVRISGAGIDKLALTQTLDAMRGGAPIIAQGALRVAQWGGRLDILRRVGGTSLSKVIKSSSAFRKISIFGSSRRKEAS
jgi:hypothetical protein